MTTKQILVWDLPTRLNHWLMAGSFVVAYATGESEAWRLVHVAAGLTLAALVAFRLVWGVAGSRHARFAGFVRGPAAVLGYLAGLVRGQPGHWAGHNPAGGWMILGLLALGGLTAVSGLGVYLEWGGGDAFEDLHEAVASLMLAAVGIHLLGVVSASLLHRENLVRAMVTGLRRGEAGEAIPGAYAWALVLPIMAVAAAIWFALRL
jgi:cytochrome b